MMPELCVDSSDTTLKVIAVERPPSPIVSGSYVCMYHFIDAKATKLFGGKKGLAFLSEVRCIGPEKKLVDCPHTEARDHRCLSAGVTCRRSASENTILTKISTSPHSAKRLSCIILDISVFCDQKYNKQQINFEVVWVK